MTAQFAAAPAGWRVWYASPSSAVPLVTEPLAGWAWSSECVPPPLTPVVVDAHGRAKSVEVEYDVECLGVTGPDPSVVQVQAVATAYWVAIDEVVRQAVAAWPSANGPVPADLGPARAEDLATCLTDLIYGGGQ
ncbi:hypothetical protein [Pseudonocardia alni]|uniref:hypothetical protein n=1 Tax=Pseudonocardia alni TaxID=33907 RepID=UPI0033184881